MLDPEKITDLEKVLTGLYLSALDDDTEGGLTPDQLKVILDGGTAAIAVLCAGLAAGGRLSDKEVEALIAADNAFRDRILAI